MQVRMLVTKLGSPDGIRVNEYRQGEVHDLPLSLAQVFLANGWAEQDKMMPGPSEFKVDETPAVEKSGKKKGGAKAK